MTATVERAKALHEQMIAWRRDIHAHPELGFHETRTARIAADHLRSLGMEVTVGAAKTGVVGLLGDAGPVIALRADMDALPIPEANAVAYASSTPGVMHAGGHDAHTAMLMGAATILAEMPNRPPGQIRFLFQPCEETNDADGKSGGQRMVEEGYLDDVAHVVALHVDSDMQAGKIVTQQGYMTANVDNFYATIIGRGTHGAHPDLGVDPIFLLGQVLSALQGIVARRVDPTEPAVVTVGVVSAGLAGGENVIPGEAKFSGTLRSYSSAVREQLVRDVEATLSLVRALGGDYALRVVRTCPSTYNDPAVTMRVEQIARELFGPEVIAHREPSLGGEDFSYMTARAPGMMFNLGAKKDEVRRPHHNPLFDIDESVLPTGAAMLAESALRLLYDLERRR